MASRVATSAMRQPKSAPMTSAEYVQIGTLSKASRDDIPEFRCKSFIEYGADDDVGVHLLAGLPAR